MDRRCASLGFFLFTQANSPADTSANLHYPSTEIASSALTHLSASPSTSISPDNPLTARPAKPHPTNAHLALSLRQAVTTDRKRPRAHESSRFYLLNPDHDPRERRRRHKRGSDGEYSRPKYGDREHRRRRKDDATNGFSANMYDDDGAANGESSDRARSRRRGSSRSRSASPGGSRDRNRRRDRGRRRRTPPPRYSADDSDPTQGKNVGKELFPTGANRRAKVAAKELFPNKNRTAATALKEELFPDKARRKDAALETADLFFAKRMTVPFVDGAGGGLGAEAEFPLRSDGMSGRRAVDDWAQEDGVSDGLSIRGAGKERGLNIRGSAGLNIKGAAEQRQAQKLAADLKVRELFPEKATNKGKELFPERKRNKAADLMFG